MVALGTLLHIVGMATPNWIQVQEDSGHTGSFGLWKICVDSVCVDYLTKTSELIACEAFSILAIFPAAAVLLLCLTHLVKHDADNRTKRVQIFACLLLSLLSGLCVMVCIFVWRFGFIKTDQFAGYSFYLSIVGGSVLILSSGFFHIYNVRFIRGTYQVMQ
ncbi:hypothetical protein Btru_037214 [Bulinus truncatus]|nr:hypothetical protein Btru_037214 [Bulinus truncatus]